MTGLSAAEIFGTILGAILVVVVFGTLYMTFLTPNRAALVFTTIRMKIPSSMASASEPAGFDNPVVMQVIDIEGGATASA